MKKILIVNANYYDKISKNLVSSSKKIFINNKMKVNIFNVTGVFEIPVAIKKNIKKFDAFVALGCVIKGETDHYHYICDAVANGIMNLTLKSSKSILFGVLTCQNKSLASDRSGNDMSSNKGYELGLMVRNILLEERNENFSNH